MREVVEALQSGSLNDLKRELERVRDINGVSRYTGFSLLHFAVIPGNDPEKIKAILEKGANPNLRSRGGYTPLHLAALKSSDPESIDVLIDGGARVNPNENRKSKTPLHLAVQASQNPEVSLRLVARGADMDLRDAEGNTPLQLSDQKGAGGHLRAYSDERKSVNRLLEIERQGIRPTETLSGDVAALMEKAFTTTLNHYYKIARPIRRSKSLSDLEKKKRLPKRRRSI